MEPPDRAMEPPDRAMEPPDRAMDSPPPDIAIFSVRFALEVAACQTSAFDIEQQQCLAGSMAEAFLAKAKERTAAAAKIARGAEVEEDDSYRHGRDNHDADDFNRSALLDP